MSRGLELLMVGAVLLAPGCADTGAAKSAGGTSGAGAGARAQLVARIDSIANAPIVAGKVAGMSVAVVKGRDTLVLKGYGKADLELDVPTPPRAAYEIASVTKQFTASAILQLAEAKKLDLDDDITKYLPGYNTQGNKITVRHLLDHTSGIKGYTEIPEFRLLAFQHLPKDTLVKVFSNKPFDFKPGEQETYNNSAYFLAGLIIEKASGQTYADYVKEHLFAKAGMSDSYYCSEKAIHKNHVHGYDADSTGLVLKAYIDYTWPYAAGSLCSTIGDMLGWNLALHGGKVLSPAAYAELIKPSELSDGTKLRYAKGLELTDIAGHHAIHHDGGIFGFTSESEYFPEDSLVIVILQNTAGPVGAGETAATIAEAILGKAADQSQKFVGDLTPFAGRYKGRGRGGDNELTIKADGGALILTGAGPTPDTLKYYGNDTFGLNSARITFKKTGAKVTGLDVDTGGGYNRLARQ